MNTLDLIHDNLVSPPVLAFFLGIVAALIHSDLKLPESIVTGLSIYFLFGLGLQGGVQLVANPWDEILFPLLMAALLGASIPILCTLIIASTGPFSSTYAAAIASHYGFVSAVTLYAAMTWLTETGITYERYLPALAACLEMSSLLSVLCMGRVRQLTGGYWWQISQTVLVGTTILLLIGGTTIGVFTGPEGYELVAPFFLEPFEGIACLFMLHLGVVAASRLGDLTEFGVGSTLLLGILLPLCAGVLGVCLGQFAELSTGGMMALGAITASSSYLASAIAVRVTMPKLSPQVYFTTSLAVSLPFNLVLGFPILLYVAEWLQP